jgi:hypothetical protein
MRVFLGVFGVRAKILKDTHHISRQIPQIRPPPKSSPQPREKD